MRKRKHTHAGQGTAPLTGVTAWLSENKGIIRFCVLFGVILGAFTFLLDTDFLQQNFMSPHLKQVALCAGSIIQFFGTSCTVSETTIFSSRFSVNVVQGCDSIYPTAMLWAALLAYPSTWKSKLIGIAGGAAVLFIVNIIRIVTMFYIGIYVPSLFDMVHVYAWQALFILLTLAVWLIWAAKISRTPVNI